MVYNTVTTRVKRSTGVKHKKKMEYQKLFRKILERKEVFLSVVINNKKKNHSKEQ